MEDIEDTINYINESVIKDNHIIFPNLGRKNGKRYSIAKYVESVVNPKVYCKFCGRQLKNRESKLKGYGQSCFDRWSASKNTKRRLI